MMTANTSIKIVTISEHSDSGLISQGMGTLAICIKGVHRDVGAQSLCE